MTLHHNGFQNTNSRNPSADNIALCHAGPQSNVGV